MLKHLCLTLAILSTGAGAALAHSFNLLLIVPAEAQAGEDMRLAVLLAADERDGHPDNHSDGHLGGLDVYLTDTMQLSAPEAWGEAEPDIVIDVLMARFAGEEEPDWLRISLQDLELIDRQATLNEAADPSVAPFAERFRAETGREPGAAVEAAYVAARIVDLIVRPLDDGGDAEALRRELDALK